MRGAIAKEREALQVLTVEWAFLNAPDRLSRLVKAHQDNLGLVPIASEAMKHVAAIPFPVPEFEEDPVTTPFAGGYPVPAARPVGWVTE